MTRIVTLMRTMVFASLAAASPSMAVSVVATNCVSVADSHGCLFSGLITAASVADTQAKYNLFNDTHAAAAPDIRLAYLFNSDTSGFPGTRTGLTSGSWTTPGYKVLYLAVNAGPNSVLYRLPGFVSGGSWSTVDIPHGPNLREIRSLAFFGTAVPEPMAWTMMIAGFLMVGTAMRRRQPSRAAAA